MQRTGHLLRRMNFFKMVLNSGHCNKDQVIARRTIATETTPAIQISPCPAIFDEVTEVQITGLNPNKKVTLVAVLLNHKTAKFLSYAHYHVNNTGTLDVSRDASSGGTYTGAEPMGYMWSMKAEDGSRPGNVYFKKDIPNPDLLKLYVLNNHVNITSTAQIPSCSVLCEAAHEKTYMAPTVRRFEVKEGRIRGSLYLPEGDGPFPGVINIYGVAPGLLDSRAALLARRGFATLGLAYFGYDDLPGVMEQKLDMEYLEEAVEWFANHNAVDTRGVGVMGYSKGCDMALYMALASKKVRAAVIIAGFDFYTTFEHFKDGKLLPTFRSHQDYIVNTPEGVSTQDLLHNADISEDCIIPLEEAPWTNYLFVNGEDDHAVNPGFTDKMVERLKSAGLSNYTIKRYADAGHMLEVPYTPVSRTVYSGWYKAVRLMGGTPPNINKAQEQSWTHIIQFFNQHLR